MFFLPEDRQRTKRIEKLVMNLTEAFASLTSSNTQLTKALAEVDSKVDTLVALVEQLQNQQLTPEQQATVTQIATVAQALDDIVPDETSA